jgi:hypothetical protein
MSFKFGLCPKCGGSDGYLNVGPYHFFVCDVHKTRWQTKSHCLDWETETLEQWEQNIDKLAAYTEVEPVFNRRLAVYPVWKYGEV